MLTPPFSAAALSEALGLALLGTTEESIQGVATLERAERGQLAFLSNPRYAPQLEATRASLVIARPAAAQAVFKRRLGPPAFLLAESPYLAYAKAAALFSPQRDLVPGCHPSAVIDPAAQVSPKAAIGPFCHVAAGAVIEAGVELGPGTSVGPDCVVGEDCVLVGRVTLVERVRLGRRVLIHPGAVLGADGFGIAADITGWIKVPQLGGVVIGDDCEIGANTTIDRGALGDTTLGIDVRLDNQIQIGHNVEIGDHTAMAGCSAVAGSAKIGRHCLIGGGVGILGHLEIADRVTVTAMSMVSHSISEAGVWSSGMPAEEAFRFRRNAARFRRLDQLARSVESMRRSKSPTLPTTESKP